MAALEHTAQGSGNIETDGEGVRRRDFINVAAVSFAGVGAVAAVVPLLSQMNPSADVLALASTEVDLRPIQAGQRITVTWRGKPVFIDNRTPEQIKSARDVPMSDLPDPEPDAKRVKPGKDNWLILVGVCTHLGCVPLGQKQGDARGDFGGWFCPCHGSHYDTAGRIRQGPAPRNLEVPPYEFQSDTQIKIG